MPTPLVKAFAKEAGKKPKTVDKMWKKAEATVKDKYDIDEESDRFYPLVVGVLKNLLGIRKKELIKEDGEGGGESGDIGGMDTTSMGDYQFAPRLGQVVSFPAGYVGSFMVASKKKEKNYKSRVKKLKSKSKKKINEDFSDVFDSMCELYIRRASEEDIVDVVLEAMERYYGIDESILDEIKDN